MKKKTSKSSSSASRGKVAGSTAKQVRSKKTTSAQAAPKRAKPANREKSVAKQTGNSRTDSSVEAFLHALSHPLKPEVLALRKLILSASPAVNEEFKWNSPSFRTTDHFATINVSAKNQLRLILHTGAKKKASAAAGLDTPDPQSLLKWLAKDRAMVTIDSPADLESKRAPLKAFLVHWIKLV